MRTISLLTLFCVSLANVMTNPTLAAPATQPSADFKKLETLTIDAGNVRTRVEAAKMWTISGIDFEKTVMAVEDSAFGTVVTYPGALHLGTAHFLDVPGKPGEIEKENVLELKLFVDDKPVTGITPKMNLSGRSFRMERKSKIRAIDLESTVDIRDDILVETAHLRTTDKPVELQMSYPLMYAWSPETTAYVFGDDNGIHKRGRFLEEGGKKSDEGLEKKSRWMSVFEPKSGKGAVCYLAQHPKTDEAWLQWTDAPKVYHKLRIMSYVGKTIPANYDGTFQSIIGFFNATESDWEAKAMQRMTELKSRAAKTG